MGVPYTHRIPECDHEWQVSLDGTMEICRECGEQRDYDPTPEDDGRDFTPPYEP